MAYSAEQLDKFANKKERKYFKKVLNRKWRRIGKFLLDQAPIKKPYKKWVS